MTPPLLDARACELARSVGVPTPRILAVEPTYLICAEVPGSPPNADAEVAAGGDWIAPHIATIGNELAASRLS